MRESVRAIADAVLYEGFLLFPYGKNALKNRMPFQFGVVMPQGYADASEPPFVRAQCVLSEGERAQGLLRFLQIAGDPVEREVPFVCYADGTAQNIPFETGGLHGALTCTWRTEGKARVLTLEIRNLNRVELGTSRNDALTKAFVSLHVLLEAPEGAFASSTDPPEAAKAAVARCVNHRMYPVLVGDEPDGTQASATVLLSPIILYDFPRIAQASTGRTFDGTEIDELLMLGVASLSDQEKLEARAAHPFVRDLVERAEALDASAQQSLHGEIVRIAGADVTAGSRVRVNPKGRADVWDDLVRGKTARVTNVQTDLEGKRYVGVVFDDDPAGEMHEWYGRSFFYGADEVEPIT